MIILENILGALGAISTHKLRSGLTMLGIIIGVASVVLMIAIGQGAQRQVTSRIESLGTNLLTISPGSPEQSNVRFGPGQGGGGALPLSDLKDIREQVGNLTGIAPENRTRMQVIHGNKNASTNIIGTTADEAVVRNLTMAMGSFFTDADDEAMAKVVVLGSQIRETLFAEGNPLGESVRIGNVLFTVIGVTASKGQQGFMNLDDAVFVPLATMQRRLTGDRTVQSINVSVTDQSAMSSAQEILTAVLLNAHEIVDPAKQDFTILNQADAVETLNEITDIFTLLLGGIAAISLLVGGIGVMNIMLVSVTERTREIGIRKAIGAKKRDILMQFLVEAVVLSILGGLFGILLSMGAAMLVTTIFELQTVISISSIVLATLFSAGIGVFFGMLPAWNAAKLRPIDALRYE